ncbi:DUF262 domain-containing protein [Aeromicrobium ponti]|uniref:Uncharacterized protein with ParB-like and HNH nuclease domain n=1 Tax=Cytobacillus oceanisediminis TaxID=665099 RepID=A0A562JWF4_9BACI|nr:DUF262 domain-containing protein [Cytobacillus oceanisediminis]TWH87499.1 uncharacterized protein with ParB-like and HNH nuclease domain [Cytobacillus oceanisediminis]
MKATESIIQPMIEGTKQYVIPLFQRTYSWSTSQWKQLWDDILEIRITHEHRSHFIGSIVSMSMDSEPHEVQKYIVIDGQQRLTTLSILLIAIRDAARESGDKELAEEIHENLLVNKWKTGDSFYKLLPTQVDRQIYKYLIDASEQNYEKSGIKQAYDYFRNKISKTEIDFKEFKTLLSTRLSLVSIVLASDDNPYLVFESLNAKGRPLTQADLIRNFFFMRISSDKHEEVYQEYWKPMQDYYQDSLTEYIRHFLARKGKIVRSSEVYLELKESVSSGDIIEHVKELHRLSEYYRCILNPDLIDDLKLRSALNKINRIEAKTSYPFLLNMFTLYREGKLLSEEFVNIVSVIENYLIRRFVCDIATNELNKIFLSLIQKVNGFSTKELLEEVKAFLQNKGYPKDQEFRDKLLTTRLYGSGDRARKTKFILESIEESYRHKEKINYGNLTIEHIMPQTLSDSWKISLGEEWENILDEYLHVLGNLTLTAYNSEMSNETFQKKRKNLGESHLEINKTFRNLNNWGIDEIKARTNLLADKCLQVWSYFGSHNNEIKDVKGTSPRLLTILGKNLEVSTWREVWITTLNEVIQLKEGNFFVIQEKYPNLFSSDINKFKRRSVLKNDIYVNVDFSARDIYRLSLKILEIIGVPKEEWNVEFVVN